MVETLPELKTEAKDGKELSLYSGIEFFQRLAGDVSNSQAGDRIAIMTMSFEPTEPLVKQLVDELHAAADRRVDIALGVDAYTMLVDDSVRAIGPLWLPVPLVQGNFRRRQQALEALAEKPTVAYSLVNQPKRLLSNPYAGRSHLKTAVVNNRVYLGGPNFHKSERVDMVVGFEDPRTADWLHSLSRRIIANSNTASALGNIDQAWALDERTKILIDRGKPSESLILDEALRLISEADEHIIVSFQFFPGGEIARSLTDAHNRKIDVRPFHNHPSQFNLWLGMRERLARRIQHRYQPDSFAESELPRGAPPLHSKAIATEKAAMVGSHNYVDLGVRFGTPEIALLREDPIFARAVGSLLLEQTWVIETADKPRTPTMPIRPSLT